MEQVPIKRFRPTIPNVGACLVSTHAHLHVLYVLYIRRYMRPIHKCVCVSTALRSHISIQQSQPRQRPGGGGGGGGRKLHQLPFSSVIKSEPFICLFIYFNSICIYIRIYKSMYVYAFIYLFFD